MIIIIWIPLQSYRWLLSVAYPSEPDLLKFLDLLKNQLNSNLSNAMAAGSAGNGTDPETEIRSQRVFLMLQYQKKNKWKNCKIVFFFTLRIVSFFHSLHDFHTWNGSCGRGHTRPGPPKLCRTTAILTLSVGLLQLRTCTLSSSQEA